MDWTHAVARSALAVIVCSGTLISQTTIPPKLTLDAAVDLALTQRQELAAASAGVEARRGAELQASLRPNPVISFQSENWRGWQSPSFAPASDLELFAYVTDTIETGGKRKGRTAVAASRTRAAELERDVLAWAVRRDVSEAWWRAAGGAERLERLRESRETLDELVRYQQTRLDLGAIAEIDVIKVRVEAERMAAAVAAAEAEAEQARLMLLSLMGVSDASPGFEVAPPADAGVDPSLPDVDEAARKALESRPDLAMARALVASAQTVVELERATAKPNLNPYLGYKRAGAYDTLIGGVSLPLPMRDRNQGNIAQAIAEVERAEATLRALEARVRTEAAAAATEVERRRAIVESVRSGARERAAQTFRIAREAYEEQGVDLLFLLDAQRALHDVELLYTQSLLDYRLSRERLAAATGYALNAGGAQ